MAACTPDPRQPETFRAPDEAGAPTTATSPSAPTAMVIPVAPVPAPLATNEPDPPPAPAICDSSPAPPVPSCEMKNACKEGGDVRTECRIWARALAPRSATKVVECFKNSPDPKDVCDYKYRERCVHGGFLAACVDSNRFRAKCMQIARGCEQGAKSAYDRSKVDIDKCIALLSATSAAGERPMIACIEEYCGTVDESCLSYRVQYPRMLK
jgi:hypothetical protein